MTATTKVSTKGQVILPKAVRDAKRWPAGTMLAVEMTDKGVLLREAAVFPPKTVDEVFGMIPYDGPPKTLEDMNAGITAEVKRRHDRGRY